MGLEYFATICPAQEETTAAATNWCVAKEGTCCGVCPNTLASLGSRIGLTFTIFFATVVTVVDGAEAPFTFLTASLQAIGYIATILTQGLLGSGISKFHAYYALLSSLGFLAPLAAASCTAQAFLYGGGHVGTGKKLKKFRLDIRPSKNQGEHRDARSLPISSHDGLTSFAMRSLDRRRASVDKLETRPLTSTDIFDRDHSTSRENSPRLLPTDSATKRTRRKRQDEEAALQGLHRATPSSLSHRESFDFHSLGEATLPHSSTSAYLLGRRPREEQRSGPHRAAPLVSPSPRPLEQRPSFEDYPLEWQEKIESVTGGAAWRRYGMLTANIALSVVWLVTFLLVEGVIPNFTLTQTDCTDPSGTKLLLVASISLIAFAVLLFPLIFFRFYTHVLPRLIARVFEFSDDGKPWTRLAVPAIVAGLVYLLWSTLLWTAYELAAEPSSSLIANSEQDMTYTTVLSISLCIKPVFDLVKACTKMYKRKYREKRKAATEAAAAAAESEPSSPRHASTSTRAPPRPHSPASQHHLSPPVRPPPRPPSPMPIRPLRRRTHSDVPTQFSRETMDPSPSPARSDRSSSPERLSAVHEAEEEDRGRRRSPRREQGSRQGDKEEGRRGRTRERPESMERLPSASRPTFVTAREEQGRRRRSESREGGRSDDEDGRSTSRSRLRAGSASRRSASRR